MCCLFEMFKTVTTLPSRCPIHPIHRTYFIFHSEPSIDDHQSTATFRLRVGLRARHQHILSAREIIVGDITMRYPNFHICICI